MHTGAAPPHAKRSPPERRNGSGLEDELETCDGEVRGVLVRGPQPLGDQIHWHHLRAAEAPIPSDPPRVLTCVTVRDGMCLHLPVTRLARLPRCRLGSARHVSGLGSTERGSRRPDCIM